MNYLRELVSKNVKILEKANTIEDLENLKKYKLIEELLKDDACFFKINSSIAYSILIELGIDNPFDYYKEIISNYRDIAYELDMTKLEEYLDYFNNGNNLFAIIQREVF